MSTRKHMKNTVNLTISQHELSLFRYAIAQQLKKVKQEFDILLITKNRELTQPEKWQLPANLQQMTRDEMCEQIDAWKSLHSSYQYWSNELETLNEETT